MLRETILRNMKKILGMEGGTYHMKLQKTGRCPPPFEEEYIDALKDLAQKKAVGYQTLMRMWIVERLNRERMKK